MRFCASATGGTHSGLSVFGQDHPQQAAASASPKKPNGGAIQRRRVSPGRRIRGCVREACVREACVREACVREAYDPEAYDPDLRCDRDGLRTA
jgi:hypothetical protein